MFGLFYRSSARGSWRTWKPRNRRPCNTGPSYRLHISRCFWSRKLFAMAAFLFCWNQTFPVLISRFIHIGHTLCFFYLGMETSRASLTQSFLDFLHDPTLQKRIQQQIDDQFEPNHTITLKDRYILIVLLVSLKHGVKAKADLWELMIYWSNIC